MARNLGTSTLVDPNSPPFPSSPRLSRSPPHVDAHLVEPVLAIVREVAAREIMPRYLKVAHSRKADGSLFTEADLATQDALKSALSALVPVPVLAEEMTQQEQALQWLEGDAGLWCVDPIDGTSNFVNGLPYFAVSVALMRQGRPVLGVVYDPVADEAFHAAHGCGAFLNGEQLPIKTYVPVLENAMAGQSSPSSRRCADVLHGKRRFADARGPEHERARSSLEPAAHQGIDRFDTAEQALRKLFDFGSGLRAGDESREDR